MPYADDTKQVAAVKAATALYRKRAAGALKLVRALADADPPLPAEQAQSLARAALGHIATTTTDPAARQAAERALTKETQG